MNERIAARVILLNQNNKVLLLKMQERTTYWLSPGGGKEDNETLFKTAQRELFEETGIESAAINPTHSWYSESVLLYKETPTLFKQYYFIGHITNSVISFDNVQEDEKGIKDYQWCSIQEIDQLTHRVYPTCLTKMLTDFFTYGIRASSTILEE